MVGAYSYAADDGAVDDANANADAAGDAGADGVLLLRHVHACVYGRTQARVDDGACASANVDAEGYAGAEGACAIRTDPEAVRRH